MAKWSPGKQVVVLGAGATRGASFVADNARCRPPLNSDFFTQLQRVDSKKHKATIDAVLRDVVKLFGPNFDLTLERYFTQVEAMIEIVKSRTSVDLSASMPDRRLQSELTSMRVRLLHALAIVLEESCDVSRANGAAAGRGCSHHAAVVSMLSKKDTILSFNYDCVIDNALKRDGAGKWSAQYGYCFPATTLEGFDFWNAPDAPRKFNESINLLKLHGSLNWFPFPETGNVIKLRQRLYAQNGPPRYEIVPPEHVKRFDTRPSYGALWKRAEVALRKAESLTFIGFSFSPTDLHVDSLFRLAMREHPALKRVVIVNPDRNARRHTRSVLHNALAKGVRVMQFESFRDWAIYVQGGG